MAITKIEQGAIATGAVDSTNLDSSVNDTINNVTIDTVFTGDSITVPVGDDNSRPTPAPGMLRYNSSSGLVENYNSAGWQGIDAPPSVIGISGIINENTDSTITINGSNFKSGAIVYIEGNGVGGVPRGLATTYVGTSTLTANTNASNQNFTGGGSFAVKVVNPSGLSGVLDPAGYIDRDPVWATGSGNIGTFTDREGAVSTTLSASDPDGTSVTYGVQSGSTLPSGLSLDANSGVISGDPDDVSGDTTYPFTIEATSNSQTTPRLFNIIINRALDGSSSDRAASSAQAIYDLDNSVTGDAYYINFGGSLGTRQVRCEFLNGEGFYVVANMSMGWRSDLKWSANDITGWRGGNTNYGSVTNAYNSSSPQYRDGNMWYGYSGTKVGVMVHAGGTQFGNGSYALFNLDSSHTNQSYYDLFRNYGNGGGVKVSDAWYAQAGMSTGGSPNATTGHHSDLDYCCLSRALGPSGHMRVQHSMNNNGARLLFSYQYLETANEDRTRGLACNYAKTSGDPDGTDGDWNTPGSPVWMSAGGNFAESYRSYRPTIPNSSAVYPDNSDASSRSHYSPYTGTPYEYALLIK